MPYCGQCGADVRGARFCAQCGAPVDAASPWTPIEGVPVPEVDGPGEHLLGALAYLTPVPAVAFLLIEPYRSNRFIRFHSYQCLLLTATAIVLSAATGIIFVFSFLEGLLSNALQIAVILAWALAAYRAWQGDEYSLPLIGKLAKRYAR